ncbi:hypothetical protein [Paraburkholderia antibiotica]|uniref:Uncharacterized protein n=1 Tax=Paraburkholderia antibiotica TaxID=2728839 RepID=A0A7Y0FFT4_9BURK|nr:hypothetical protein [Paraburkholderia antibiotica]NML34516.1 hypothetical protein [Paraburkholderia antibiotica]
MPKQFAYRDAHGTIYPAHSALAFQPELVPGQYDTDTKQFTPTGNPQRQTGTIITDASANPGRQQLLSGLGEDRGAHTAPLGAGVAFTLPADDDSEVRAELAEANAKLADLEAQLSESQQRVAVLEAQNAVLNDQLAAIDAAKQGAGEMDKVGGASPDQSLPSVSDGAAGSAPKAEEPSTEPESATAKRAVRKATT